MNQNFFEFSSKLISSTLQAHPIGLKKDINGIDEEWNLIKGKYKDIVFPVVFKQVYGKKYTDILDTGWPNLYLISKNMKIVFQENHLLGWETFPIKLYAKNGDEILDYFGLSITGKCIRENYNQSSVIEKKGIVEGSIIKFYKGIAIDGWDGSDLFSPSDSYSIYISCKAAELIRLNQFSNVELKNLGDIETEIPL